MRLFVVLACAALAAVANAQEPDDTMVVDGAGARAVEVWAGYSHSSPKWGVLGNRPGMSFAIAAARLTRRIKTTAAYGLDYTVDIIPVALSSPPLGQDYFFWGYDGRSAPADCSALRCRFPPGSAYGAGVSPLGITAVYRQGRALQPRLGATAGVLMFDRPVPTVYSTRFNFTASIEAGLQLLNRRGSGVLAVYRFHHISNAGTGEDNSALASHVISIGIRLAHARQN
jgi:hypothetical protein